MTESDNETLELLMKMPFSCSKNDDNEESEEQVFSILSVPISKFVVSMINEENIAWAVSSFQPYKSPDGIFAAVRERSLSLIMSCLIVVFTSFLAS